LDTGFKNDVAVVAWAERGNEREVLEGGGTRTEAVSAIMAEAYAALKCVLMALKKKVTIMAWQSKIDPRWGYGNTGFDDENSK